MDHAGRFVSMDELATLQSSLPELHEAIIDCGQFNEAHAAQSCQPRARFWAIFSGYCTPESAFTFISHTLPCRRLFSLVDCHHARPCYTRARVP